jgi:uncharacterized protein
MISHFDYDLLWQQGPLSLLTYAFLAAAIVSLWIKRHFAIWAALLAIATILGLLSHRLELLSLITLFALGLGFYLCFTPKFQQHRFLQIQFGILSFAISILTFFHFMPGFRNLLVVDQLKLTADAIPYTVYLNFDKPLVGLFILAFGFSYVNYLDRASAVSRADIKKAALVIGLALITMPLLGLATHYVRFELKWDNFIILWFFINLIFTCVAEEALFRGLIQNSLSRSLKKFKWGSLIALIIASGLFGLAHFRGGMAYVILATIAGIFYGTAYMFTKRIEASILTHFLVNSTHILFFTYPALAPLAL